ncbi:LacI family DNA-binding transcriptional regulator [uncultured Ruegeria sp.]|uniref:LacI family DNA-binding transcriptional regulator n=1 Tax=uncultured Ruegeria sp. TaxID=259304 RepID=UPI0026168470|nr:LacI family DNA-binding transcriptional regulator [uncultured Ruegeria sp.]
MTNKNPGRTHVTMRDVAKAAGVSRMTVSRALKKNSPISKETRDHILQVVKQMNYVPDQMAGSLTTKKSGFVAVLLPSLNNLHFALTVQSLTEELEKVGLQLLLGHTDYSAEREEQLVETMLRRRPEAIVLSYDGHTQRTLDLLADVSVPIVEIWEKPQNPIAHTVGFSNSKAAYDMTQALIERGFKNIVFLGEGQDDWTRGAARREGFEQAMSSAGLDAKAQIMLGTPPLTIENGAAAVDHILDRYPNVDCVFCVSDMAAFGVQSRLLQIGKAVPDEISVVGFGNFEVSRFSSPSISTVVVDPTEIGRQTGKLISQLLADEETRTDSPCHVTLTPRIEFRESCRFP